MHTLLSYVLGNSTGSGAMRSEHLFRLGKVALRINHMRKPETRDIVRRLLVIPPERIILKNLLSRNPSTAFNPTIRVSKGEIKVYTRIIIGYYTYSSAIAEFTLKLDDIYEGVHEKIEAEVTITPESEVDFWGTEDPRITTINEREFITYTGRTRWFFEGKVNRTVPIVAERRGGIWTRRFYLKLPPLLDQIVSLNKDAFIQVLDDKVLHVFHRPIFETSPPSLWHGTLSLEVLDREKFREEIIMDNELVMFPADFERNVGWGAPLLKIDDRYIAIVHARGVDEVYRLYSLLLTLEGDSLEIAGVSETYIMEPREIYERYGDRPNVVFICGAEVMEDRVLISYGAADHVVAFGEIELSELVNSIREIK